MQSLEGVRRRIDTAEELESVVKTMKGVAAANIRQFEAAVAALGEYARTVTLGLQALLASEPDRLLPEEPAAAGPLGAVVFGSDQGMCGRFNQQIAEHAAKALRAAPAGPENRTVLVIGTRVVGLLEAAGVHVEERISPATSLPGITDLVQELLLRIQGWRSSGRAERVVLCYNEATGGATYGPRTLNLVPVDMEWLRGLRREAWPSRQLPAYTLRWERLLASLVRELLHMGLYRAAAESMASENASRLQSMQAAERNIEDKLADLEQQFRVQRQHQITEELLDIVSGFEALASEGA
jgi:F-type H+-transporting ATPase subunit gamma